jgi:hypothetical protein
MQGMVERSVFLHWFIDVFLGVETEIELPDRVSRE